MCVTRMWMLQTRGNVPLASITDPTTQKHPFRPSRTSQGRFLMIKNNALLLGPFLLAERFQSPHLISAPSPSPSTTGEGAESQSWTKLSRASRWLWWVGWYHLLLKKRQWCSMRSRRIKSITYDTGQTVLCAKAQELGDASSLVYRHFQLHTVLQKETTD